MENEFKRLLKNQFGAKNYAHFVSSMKDGMNQSPVDHNCVYIELYLILKSFQPSMLRGRHRQLEEAMVNVLRICNTYFLAVFVYLLAMLLLLLFGTVPTLTYIGLGLLTLAFGIKTGEFLANKYCYVDARIVITYKSVLERLLKEAEEEGRLDHIS